MAESTQTTRRYDSPLRREQAAQTRDRIIDAGCELQKQSLVRDWQGLTVRAVADRAGVHERTVYRYFQNERGLRDAVLHRLEENAGIDLARMRLEDVVDVATRTLRHVSSYRIEPKPLLDPTLRSARERQHESLRSAVGECTSTWSGPEREAAAAMFDVLWSVGSYERLIVDWQMNQEQAVAAITWAISLVEQAVRQGSRPRA